MEFACQGQLPEIKNRQPEHIFQLFRKIIDIPPDLLFQPFLERPIKIGRQRRHFRVVPDGELHFQLDTSLRIHRTSNRQRQAQVAQCDDLLIGKHIPQYPVNNLLIRHRSVHTTILFQGLQPPAVLVIKRGRRIHRRVAIFSITDGNNRRICPIDAINGSVRCTNGSILRIVVHHRLRRLGITRRGKQQAAQYNQSFPVRMWLWFNISIRRASLPVRLSRAAS